MSDIITESTLQAINRELHQSQFTQEDVAGLLDGGHGAISSLDRIFADLRRICARDLGLVAPDAQQAPEQRP